MCLGGTAFELRSLRILVLPSNKGVHSLDTETDGSFFKRRIVYLPSPLSATILLYCSCTTRKCFEPLVLERSAPLNKSRVG